MPVRRLILVEGMIGAGKSATAERLAARLSGDGRTVRAFHELASDHPIRTRAVDLVRAADRRPTSIPADDGAYDVAQWGVLAAQCRRGDHTVVLEATFLQNSILPLFLDGAQLATIKDTTADIERRIVAADPLLVYLRPSDIEAAVHRVHAERGEPWSSRSVEFVSATRWARRRGVAGRRAVIELYRTWEHVVDELIAASTLASMVIVDPQRDREGTMERICAEARTSA